MEEWKPIDWYNGLYDVSNLWRVRSNIFNTKIKKFVNLWWYNRVSLSIWNWKTKKYLVHRLVFLTFNNMPLDFLWQKTKTLILHKNDIKNDNRLDNLFIWTQKENMEDMMKKWRWKTWIVKRVKIWFSDIENIKSKYIELWNIFEVAKIYWVSGATISRAINWKIWKS